MGEFGDKFRKAREAKELSLDDVSNVTKISPRMLQAIEEENFDRLPGGVFNKGFIRAYAKHLGLSPEEAITEYLECLRQAQIDAQQAWQAERTAPARPAAPTKGPAAPAPAVPAKVAVVTPEKPASSIGDKSATLDKSAATTPKKGAPKPQPAVEVEELPNLQLPREKDVRPAKSKFVQPSAEGIPFRLVVIAVIVVVLGIVLWIRHSRTAITQAENSSALPAASPTAPAPVVATAPTPASHAPGRGSPAASATSLQTPNPNSPMLPKAGAVVPSNPAPDLGSPAASVEEKNDVTIRTFGNPLPKSRDQAAAASLSLVIRATENSWLSVRADGQLVTQETLIAPANTSVHASREIVVKVGNAAGVTFLWNGKDLPAQGAEAEAKTLVFDHEGMRTLAPGQTAP